MDNQQTGSSTDITQENSNMVEDIPTNFNGRCLVDIIDFQSQADGDYKFIMIYQDYLTKFLILNSLKTKTSQEIKSHIINTFYDIGPPEVLQFNKGKEFCNNVIENLKTIFPGLEIVYDNPRHDHFLGSIRKTNQDVQKMLKTWMKDNPSKNWSVGIKMIQLMQNQTYNSEIKQVPFMAVFGRDSRNGLDSTNLPPDVIKNIKTEEDLEKALAEAGITEIVGVVKECKVCKVNTETFDDICVNCTHRRNIHQAREKCLKNLKIQAKKAMPSEE